MTVVLDSGAVSALAQRSNVAKVRALLEAEVWPPVVPSIVLAECTSGTARDAATNRLLKSCFVDAGLPEAIARHAGALRHHAATGSAVDAVVVAFAATVSDPVVLTADIDDLDALAEPTRVRVERV